MTELNNPILVKVGESVDRIARLTLNALDEHRAASLTDEVLIQKLWDQFKRAAVDSESRESGLLHMAMSCYKLALAEQKIGELEESLEFHRNAIDFMVELSDLE